MPRQVHADLRFRHAEAIPPSLPHSLPHGLKLPHVTAVLFSYFKRLGQPGLVHGHTLQNNGQAQVRRQAIQAAESGCSKLPECLRDGWTRAPGVAHPSEASPSGSTHPPLPAGHSTPAPSESSCSRHQKTVSCAYIYIYKPHPTVHIPNMVGFNFALAGEGQLQDEPTAEHVCRGVRNIVLGNWPC